MTRMSDASPTGYAQQSTLALTLFGLCLVLAASVLALALSGCGTKTSDRDLSFVNPTEGTRIVNTTGRGINILGSARGATWVDCRSLSDFERSRIPGAVHLPFQDLNERRAILDRYVTVIVYGSDYNDPLALGMSKRLVELGYDARTLRGGMRAWIDAGREVEAGPVAAQQE